MKPLTMHNGLTSYTNLIMLFLRGELVKAYCMTLVLAFKWKSKITTQCESHSVPCYMDSLMATLFQQGPLGN